MTTPTAVCEPELSQNEILTHLDEVLADRRFASAERNAKFLRYVVERTLEGKAHEVKETVIATEVYGRAGSYDPKTDSIVRVEASRLRQKLRTYYENEGRSATVRIHLRSGTYVPQFEQVAGPLSELEKPMPVLPQPILTVTPTEMVSSQRKVSKLPATAFVTLAVIVAGSLWLQAAKSAKGPESRDPDAIAALQEGIALLQQDPHVAHAENGAPQTVVRAIERLEFAVARDPKLARAWATLSEAYNYAFPYVGRNRAEDARRSEAAARRAIALDDNLAAGHHMLGLSLFMLK
ncbi:MAG: hypothetical protein H7039_02530, partial [Bryobacteraceae bacterium]|nr:hypothetical protein [Bryobacteraceae bacterium]